MLVVTAGLVIFGYCYAIVRGVRVHFHGEPETPEVVEA
jgi:hypothetical protein